MSAPPPGSDGLGGFDDEGLSGKSASDPEEARAAAEDALSQIESMADLDEEPDVGASEAEQTTASGSSEQGRREAGTAAPSQSDTPEDQCENCGAPLQGPYCSQCGQKAADRIVPLWHMLNEALEAVVELDMRVLWTLPKFLFLPGRLAKEYINGRRRRYIRSNCHRSCTSSSRWRTSTNRDSSSRPSRRFSCCSSTQSSWRLGGSCLPLPSSC